MTHPASKSKAKAAPLTRAQMLMAIGTFLPILQRGYRNAADKAVAHVGLSQAMAWPLVMIGRQGDGIRPGELAELLAMEGASLVRQLDQLEDAGLIERREHTIDRRAKTLHLTSTGAQACTKIEAAVEVMRATVFEGVSDADVTACLRVFTLLDSRLGRGARLAVQSEVHASLHGDLTAPAAAGAATSPAPNRTTGRP